MAISFSSCKRVDRDKGNEKVHQVLIADNFTGVEFAIGGNATISQSPTINVEIQTTQKVYDVLEIRVEDHILNIETKKGYTIKNSEEIKVWISGPNISDFINSGSGYMDVVLDRVTNFQSCELILSGSGLIHVNSINAYDQDILISGSGTINIDEAFNTNTATNISGSGVLELNGSMGNSNISISGSGQVSV